VLALRSAAERSDKIRSKELTSTMSEQISNASATRGPPVFVGGRLVSTLFSVGWFGWSKSWPRVRIGKAT
jgi:hypothetical protein